MNLISNDSGAVFGMFLFIALVVTSVTCYAIEKPVIDGINEAFDDDYRDTYMTTEGKSVVETLFFIFNSVLVFFTIMCGAIMVINRSIYHEELQ
jgi:hypothetical protein